MPFVSKAQQRWGNSPAGRAALGAKGVAEWNSATKGRKLPQRKAEGGEVNEWDALPRTPDGRPNIVVTKPPAQSMADVASGFGQRIHDWFSQPSPIKPDSPPSRDFQEPSQAIGEGMRGLGSGYLQSLKDLSNPFTKDENDRYIADQPLPPPTEKAPQTQKDPISLGAPVAAEVASTFAGKPGAGLGWGLLKSAGIGMAGAAVKKAVPKAAAAMFDHGFLDTSKFKTVSGSKGTMAGGFKVDPFGQEWYVKQAPNLEQAKNEKLTAELYKLFGTPVAEVHLTNVNGKPGIASKKIEGVQLGDYTGGYVKDLEGLHENYPVHALLANHDAVGTGPENPLGNIIVDAAGKAHVIDTGGGLLYKGTGTKKAKFTPEVVEIDTMANPNYSHLSAEVFGGVDPNVARVGAQRIADVDELQISRLVEKYGPDDKMEKLNLLSTLLKRKQNIQEMYGVQPKKASTQQVLSQALGTNEPKPVPAHDPYEQIPFTEEDYAKLAEEIPPEVVPDDAWKAPRPAEEKGVDLTTLPFAKALGNSVYISDLTNSVLPKPALQNIAKNLTSGPYDIDHWNGAVNLWQIAEHINPQLAEALFRNLPVSAQPKVGYAIKALKEELGYSPWNSVAKGSGKDGKFPLDYDFYTTKTNSFPVPDNLLKDKAYQGNVKKYSALLEKGPELPEQVAAKEEYSGIPAGYANAWLNAPKEAFKLMEHFKTGPNGMVQDYDIKGIGTELAKLSLEYPKYADHVYVKLPSHLQSAVLEPYQGALESLKADYNLKIKNKAKSGSFTKEEGENAAINYRDNAVGIEYLKRNVLKEIKDWKKWTPPSWSASKPYFSNPLKKILAEKRGFNTNFEIHKGGYYDPDPENPSYPKIIKSPEEYKKGLPEPAWFASDEIVESQTYGPGVVGGSYIARADKALQMNWGDISKSKYYDGTLMHNIIMAAKEQGGDLVAIHGIVDQSGTPHTQYAILNVAILRGPNAKFDPAMLHKAFPMAGLVGGALFTYGAIQGDDKMNRGGIPALVHRAKTLARGGPGSAPWQSRSGSHPRHPAGMIKSSIPGRTDKIPMGVPPGSYILPADVPSALGEGNTMAGEKILGTMFNSGPYGPRASGFVKQPKAQAQNLRWMRRPRFAEGGPTEQNENDIPIIAAGGEYVIYPEQVAELGHGDMKAGHRVLDKFVLSVRKKHIETLKKLKPPKK